VSKVVQVYVVDNFLKPAVLTKVDPNQYGTIPNSSTVRALISMLHSWSKSTDGNGGSDVQVMLFDFRKALNLIGQRLLVQI
jgi:hypothetical protein